MKCRLDIKKDISDTVSKMMTAKGAVVVNDLGYFNDVTKASTNITAVNNAFKSKVVERVDANSFKINPKDELVEIYYQEYKRNIKDYGVPVENMPSRYKEEDVKNAAPALSTSPKNLNELYKSNKEIFGLNNKQAFASAVAMDKMIETMAARKGVSKEDIYDTLKFEKINKIPIETGIKFQVNAWHGTPYLFDKFRTDKIGQGEGLQAYGWGLYFTELKSIAKSYARAIDARAFTTTNNKKFTLHEFFEIDMISKEMYEAIKDVIAKNPNISSKQELYKKLISESFKKKTIFDFFFGNKISKDDYRKAAFFIERSVVSYEKIPKKKNLYNVTLQKGKKINEYQWLEWDRPVPRDIVNKVTKRMYEKENRAVYESYISKVEPLLRVDNSLKLTRENIMTGEKFYRIISTAFLRDTWRENDKKASLLLLEQGIDGVKYPVGYFTRTRAKKPIETSAFNYVVFDENAVEINKVLKFQKDAVNAKGAVMITMDGQAVIYALTDPDISTPLHELAHVFEHYLTEEEKNIIIKNAKTEGWTTETSEYFARGFEKYLSEGISPVPELNSIFEKFKNWLMDIYKGIVGSDIDITLNDEMRKIYSMMFEGNKITAQTKKQEEIVATEKTVRDLVARMQTDIFQKFETEKTSTFEEMSDEKQEAIKKKIKDVAEKQAFRIGIGNWSTYEVIYRDSKRKAEEYKKKHTFLYKIIDDKSANYKGVIKVSDNIIEINLAYATLDTPIHELLAHPIIRALKTGTKSNKKLYQNLLKELDYGEGKEVLDRVKRNYQTKEDGSEYTLEEQQEEAIVELLGLMTADKLDKIEDGKLISLLKELLKEMKAFMKKLLSQKEVEIDKLPDNMTLGDISDLLAYSNSKLILPGNEVIYTTPDNQKFKTYQEASNHISKLTKQLSDMMSDFNDTEIYKNLQRLKETEKDSILNSLILDFKRLKEIKKDNILNNLILEFIRDNKEYELTKKTIEQWKKVNNIEYNPEEVYSRGHGFYSLVGAYSDFDAELMFQNLLAHIEDNKKAGGEFTISVFTKPFNEKGKIEKFKSNSNLRFKIFPKPEDIKWAANRDVYSGSVWNSYKVVSNDSKELVGVSFTKSPPLTNIKLIQPNLANIVDNLKMSYNELGIELTTNNFRLEYDDGVPYSTKKLIDNINNLLDQKYGKLVEPNLDKYLAKYEWDVVNFENDVIETFIDYDELMEFIQNPKNIKKYKYLDIKERKLETPKYKPIAPKITKDKKDINEVLEDIKNTDTLLEDSLEFKLSKIEEYKENIDNSEIYLKNKVATLNYHKERFAAEVKEYIKFNKEIDKAITDISITKKDIKQNHVEEYFLNRKKKGLSVPFDTTKRVYGQRLFYDKITGEVIYIYAIVENPDRPFDLSTSYNYELTEEELEDIMNNEVKEDYKRKIIQSHENRKERIDDYDRIIKKLSEEVIISRKKILKKKQLIREIKNQLKNDNKLKSKYKSKLQSQLLINTKIAALKKGMRVFPRTLIRSEVKSIDEVNKNYSFEQDETLFQQAPVEVKSGLTELFDSNPELANAVYETLGFKQNSKFKNSLWRGQAAKPNIDNEGNLILKPSYEELSKDYGKSFTTEESVARSYGNRYSNNPYFIEVDEDYISSNFNLRDEDVEGEKRIIGKNIIKIPKGKFNIINPSIKDYENTDVDTLIKSYINNLGLDNSMDEILFSGGVSALMGINYSPIEVMLNVILKKLKTDYDGLLHYIAEKNEQSLQNLPENYSDYGSSYDFYYFQDNSATTLVYEAMKKYDKNYIPNIITYSEEASFTQPQITSQQKQQAQQLYSQYLDTIFPDSKVKDIVYHGTNKKFDKFDKNFLSKYDVGYYGKGFYFSTKPNKSYSDKNYHKQELDGVMLSVLVNLPNPNYKASNDFSDTGKDVVKDKGVIVIDEDLDNELTEKTKTPEEFVNALLKLGKYDIDQIVVFEPEQIHILGTEQDIEGFRQWMQSQGGKDTTVLDNLISKLEQFGIIEKDCSGRSIKAKDGIRSKFTKGSQWELVKDLKGYPSHAQGGVDIKLGKDGFSFTRNGGQILAAYGLVLPNASEP